MITKENVAEFIIIEENLDPILGRDSMDSDSPYPYAIIYLKATETLLSAVDAEDDEDELYGAAIEINGISMVGDIIAIHPLISEVEYSMELDDEEKEVIWEYLDEELPKFFGKNCRELLLEADSLEYQEEFNFRQETNELAYVA